MALFTGLSLPPSLLFPSLIYYLWRKFYGEKEIFKIKIPEVERRLAKLESEKKRKTEERDVHNRAKDRLEDELKTITDELKNKMKKQEILEKEGMIKRLDRETNEILVEHTFLTYLERIAEEQQKLKDRGKWVLDKISVLSSDKKYAKVRDRFEQKLNEMINKGTLVNERRNQLKEILEEAEKIWIERKEG